MQVVKNINPGILNIIVYSTVPNMDCIAHPNFIFSDNSRSSALITSDKELIYLQHLLHFVKE